MLHAGAHIPTSRRSSTEVSTFCKAHRSTRDSQLRLDIEVEAWKQCIGSKQLELMSLGDTIALVQTLHYFERWWNQGIDGPCQRQLSEARPLQHDVLAPFQSTSRKRQQSDNHAPQEHVRPRASPLDEILE